MEIKTSHLALFTLCIIILSSIFTQRFLLTKSKYVHLLESVGDKIAVSSSNAKNLLLNALQKYAMKEGQSSTMAVDHPLVSPREGTDIHPANHDAILSCRNQSMCIVPDLQLQAKFKVYFCTKGVHQGIRFFYLAREGLLLHPNVELLPFERIHEAELVVVLPASVSWAKTECSDPALAKRLLVLEEFDGDNMFSPTGNVTRMQQMYGPSMRWYFMYFKRSFVNRKDGKFISYGALRHDDVYPMVYSVANAYAQSQFNRNRSVDITCTLRGNKHMTTRLRVQQWVAKYVEDNGIVNAVQGELNHDTRTKISRKYFDLLFNTRIIVTVNPAHWEGDFRLWESLATGAMVMVDHLFVPYPHPLQDGKHIVFFDNNNETDFVTKLDYYHRHPEEARKIAVQGYLYAMKYHRTVSMMDYFLRSAHLKLAADAGVKPLPKYKYTGQYLSSMVKSQIETIKKNNRPISYIH